MKLVASGLCKIEEFAARPVAKMGLFPLNYYDRLTLFLCRRKKKGRNEHESPILCKFRTQRREFHFVAYGTDWCPIDRCRLLKAGFLPCLRSNVKVRCLEMSMDGFKVALKLVARRKEREWTVYGVHMEAAVCFTKIYRMLQTLVSWRKGFNSASAYFSPKLSTLRGGRPYMELAEKGPFLQIR